MQRDLNVKQSHQADQEAIDILFKFTDQAMLFAQS